MMKTAKNLLLVATAITSLASAQIASALNITPATLPQWTGTQTGQSAIDTAIAPIIGSATELYKQNVGGSESGSLAGSYTATFSNSNGDSLIDYGSGNYVGPTAWLLVKDGNHSPAWYLFQLSGIGGLGWNGTDDLVLTGFWPQQGEISHVTLYGTSKDPSDTPGVPDGGATLGLLGLALLGLNRLRQRLA